MSIEDYEIADVIANMRKRLCLEAFLVEKIPGPAIERGSKRLDPVYDIHVLIS